MAQFNEAYSILTKAEFSDKPEKFLHKNKSENLLTLGGIYEKYHKTAIDWGFIHSIVRLCGYDIEEVNDIQIEKNGLEQVFPVDDFQKNSLRNRVDELDYRLEQQNNYLKRASVMLYNDNHTYKDVYVFFKEHFWDAIRLDEIHMQNTANEIFLSAVHIGTKRAVQLAQRTVGAKDDGILGPITLKCLNNYSEQAFDVEFDRTEVSFYKENNPDSIYFDGFIARAELV